MLISELVIHNVGVYGGRHEIDLTPKSVKKSVVLFGGLNGRGKTTLLDAIQLALYGKLSPSVTRSGSGYEAYLASSINRAVSPEEGAAVELAFVRIEDGTPSTYRIKRYWRKTGKSINETFKVFHNQCFDPVLTERWLEQVESILPVRVAELFFFDGERIEGFADPSSSANLLRTAVQALLGLDLVDQLGRDLDVLKRKKRKLCVTAEVEREIEVLEASREEAIQVRSSLTQSRAEKNTELSRVLARLGEVDAELQEFGYDLIQNSASLEKELTDMGARLEEEYERLSELLYGALPLTLVQEQLRKIAEVADVEVNAGRAGEVYELLLARDAELVERLENGGAPKKQVSALAKFMAEDRQARMERCTLADQPIGLTEEHLNEVKYLLDERLPSEQQATARSAAKVNEARVAIEQLERKKASIPAPETLQPKVDLRTELISEEKSIKNDIARKSDEIASQTTKIESIEKSISQKLDKHAQQLIEHQDIDKLIKHAEKVQTTMAGFRKAVLLKHVRSLEESILESLQALLAKERLITELEIDTESFALKLIGKSGELIDPMRLSAGERQLLSVSILKGLAVASGLNLPVVIDTPMGRLDSKHREYLVRRYFPVASHQVILLSTDEEVDEKLYEILRPSIAKTYTLEYSNESQSTSVKSGYLWEAA